MKSSRYKFLLLIVLMVAAVYATIVRDINRAYFTIFICLLAVSVMHDFNINIGEKNKLKLLDFLSTLMLAILLIYSYFMDSRDGARFLYAISAVLVIFSGCYSLRDICD